jgi:hypothetical protein
MDLDGWTSFSKGWTGLGVGPREMLAPRVQIHQSGLQFLLLDVEGSLFSLQLVALCG